VLVVLRMSAADAETLREDYNYEPSAPLLTGGWQENPVHYSIVSITPEEARDR
jgi:hypothetical protein